MFNLFKSIGIRTRKSIFLSASKFFVNVSSLIILMILSRALSIEEYSNYRQFIFLGGLILPLILFGGQQAIVFFLPSNREKLNQFFSISILTIFINFLLIFLLLNLFQSQILDYYSKYALENFLPFLYAWILASSILQICSSVLIGIEKPLWSGFFLVINALLLLVTILAWVYSREENLKDLNELFKIYPIIFSVTAFLIVIFISFNLKDSINFKNYFSDIKDYFIFSIPIFFSQYIGSFGRKISLIIIVPFISQEAFAIYANGAFEVPFIAIVASSAIAVISPEFIRYFKAGKLSDSLNLWRRASLKSCLIIFPIFIFLFIEANDVLIILFSEKYIDSALTFRCFLLLMPLQAVFFGLIFIAAKKPKLLLLRSSITTLTSLIITYIICAKFNPMYAPLGIVISVYFWALPYNIYFFKKITRYSVKEYLPLNKLFKLFVFSLISYIPILFIDFLIMPFLFSFAFSLIVYFVFYFILVRNYKF